MAHSDAPVLTLFDGITRGAVAVDLHFFSSSYNGSVTLLLLQGLAVLFHHSLINVYGHCVVSCAGPANVAYQACCLFIV
jgi:hypothetical protein